MKKSLIALAALAAAGVASAQSSVTLYGRLDLGLVSTKTTWSATGYNRTAKTTDLFGNQHAYTTSRLGVTGTEDLGGGLRAFFNYEFKINPDVATAVESTRLANIGVMGSFGTVQIGTFLNSLDTMRGYSAATYSVPGGDFTANHATSGSTNFLANYLSVYATSTNVTLAREFVASGGTGTGIGGRSQNAIAYRSPSFSGFTFAATASSTETSTTASGVTTSSDVRGYGASVSYNNGPLNAILAFAQAKASADSAGVSTASRKLSDVGFSVNYNFGFAVPYFIYEQTKGTNGIITATGALNSIKTRAFEIGSKFPMGAWTPYVLFGSGKFTTNFVNAGSDSFKTRAFQVGTTYDLSKRTSLYAAIGQDRVKDDYTDPLTTKRSGLALGVIHKF